MSFTTNSYGTSQASADLTAKVAPYPLLWHIQAAAAAGDPALVGATGYADDVFTLRLWGDTE